MKFIMVAFFTMFSFSFSAQAGQSLINCSGPSSTFQFKLDGTTLRDPLLAFRNISVSFQGSAQGADAPMDAKKIMFNLSHYDQDYGGPTHETYVFVPKRRAQSFTVVVKSDFSTNYTSEEKLSCRSR